MKLQELRQQYEQGVKQLLQAYLTKEKAEEELKNLKSQLSAVEFSISVLEKAEEEAKQEAEESKE